MAKILVAEDDQFLSNAYRVKLTKAGFDVRMVSDGNELFVALKDFLPDLILLDLMMPGKDGFSSLAELKQSEQWKNIPVIIASNLGQKEDIDKGMLLGASSFVVKSDLSLESLIEMIHKTIDIK